MRSLIIHLPRATARADNVAQLLKALPNAEVVDAVDGQDPEQMNGASRVTGNLHHPPYPFGLSLAEIACFLSHRRCWEMIAEGDAPYGLIAEDDMTVDPLPFGTAMELVERYGFGAQELLDAKIEKPPADEAIEPDQEEDESPDQ